LPVMPPSIVSDWLLVPLVEPPAPVVDPPGVAPGVAPGVPAGVVPGPPGVFGPIKFEALTDEEGLLFLSNIIPIRPPRPAPVRASKPLSFGARVGFCIATPGPIFPALVIDAGVPTLGINMVGVAPKLRVDSAGVLTGIAMVYPVCFKSFDRPELSAIGIKLFVDIICAGIWRLSVDVNALDAICNGAFVSAGCPVAA